MFGLPLAFAAPAVLAALVGLVALYFLLRVTPPSPARAIFPPLRLLVGLDPTETTPARTPWPILALRLAIGALIILAMAEPLWNSFAALSGSGPLLVLIDDGFAAAPAWDKRIDFARERAAARGAERSNCGDPRPVAGRTGHRAARQSRHRRPVALARAGSLRAGPRGGVAGDRALSRRASRRPTFCGSPTGSSLAAPAPSRARLASHRPLDRSRDRQPGRARACRRRQ